MEKIDFDKYYEAMEVSNNFVIRLKSLIESFNELLSLKRKDESFDAFETQAKLNEGLERLRLPVRAYTENGAFKLVVSERTK